MREHFQRRERLFVFKIEDGFVCLDTREIEGHHTIKEGLIGRKPRSMIGLIVQALSDRHRGFCHRIPPFFLVETVFSILSLCCIPYSLIYHKAGKMSTPVARAEAHTHLTTVSRTVACGGLKPSFVKMAEIFMTKQDEWPLFWKCVSYISRKEATHPVLKGK